MSPTNYSNSCGSQKLSSIYTCPGTTRFGAITNGGFGHQVFANPEFQSQQKRRDRHVNPGTPRLGDHFLDPSGEKVFVV